MFGNLTFDDPVEASNLYANVVHGDGQISSIAEATGGRFLLNSGLMGTLAKYTGFKELRIRCFKPWHDRTVDVVMKGDYLINVLTQSSTKHGLCGDDELRFLPDDMSNLRTRNCSEVNSGYSLNHVGLYNHFLYSDAGEHIHFRSSTRMECDDFVHSPSYENCGSWTYYVR